EVADPPHVVVAEDGGQRPGVGGGGGVVVDRGEQPGQPGGTATADVGHGRGLEREVQHRAHVGAAHVRSEQPRVGVVDLTEGEEVVVAGRVGVVEHLGGPLR